MQQRDGAVRDFGIDTESDVEWVRAHEELIRIARERGELELREGRALLWARRSGVHIHLGHGSFFEYVGRFLGYGRRTIQDKLRTAEALQSLPELARALSNGECNGSAARELARVATSETERDWLAAARGKTVREIERLVAGRERGDRPSDEPRPVERRHVLRFEVAADTLATFREAMTTLRRDAGERLDDDSALLLMARYVLGSSTSGRASTSENGSRAESETTSESSSASAHDSGARDSGRANYQLALTLCERCRQGFQKANGELIEVEPAVAEMVCCDAQHIGYIEPLAEPANDFEPANMSVEPATKPANMTLETHVGASSRKATKSKRATQTISPALRRQILRASTHRCRVPGCRHAIWLDLHHLEARAEGGLHVAENIAVLCGAHHRATHRGQLIIKGSATTRLSFWHADGTPYGRPPSAGAVELNEKVFSGLRNMGFKEREARQALDAATAELAAAAAATPTFQDVIRAALRRLRPRRG